MRSVPEYKVMLKHHSVIEPIRHSELSYKYASLQYRMPKSEERLSTLLRTP